MVNHGGQNPYRSGLLRQTIGSRSKYNEFYDVYEILSHMKLTYPVNNERQLKMYIDEKYKGSNNADSLELAFNRLKKGEESFKKLYELINLNKINQMLENIFQKIW